MNHEEVSRNERLYGIERLLADDLNHNLDSYLNSIGIFANILPQLEQNKISTVYQEFNLIINLIVTKKQQLIVLKEKLITLQEDLMEKSVIYFLLKKQEDYLMYLKSMQKNEYLKQNIDNITLLMRQVERTQPLTKELLFNNEKINQACLAILKESTRAYFVTTNLTEMKIQLSLIILILNNFTFWSEFSALFKILTVDKFIENVIFLLLVIFFINRI